MAEKRRKALYEALKENEKVGTEYNLWRPVTFRDDVPSAWVEWYELALVLV